MKFRSLAAAAAALSLTATPVLAADASRVSAPVAGESEFAGGSFLLILAVALMGLGLYLLVDSEDDTPESA